MTDIETKVTWGQRLSWLALALSVGGLTAALIAAVGSGAGAWPFGFGFAILRYAFFAAIAGGLLAIIAFFVARRGKVRTGLINGVAIGIALGFGGYLTNQIATARQVPAIHDATTDLADVPQFAALKLRADNLDNIPDNGQPQLASLDSESRWKAVHRASYGDLRTLRLPLSVADAVKRAEALVQARGWQVVRVNAPDGIVEATATSLFFRFKDDVVVRVRADPARPGGSVVDMRSVSRVGTSDVGINAKRIRAFLADLATA